MFVVMAGLDPAIHALPFQRQGRSVDARNKSGHDDEGASSPRKSSP
jgi:hypothetical protein